MPDFLLCNDSKIYLNITKYFRNISMLQKFTKAY